MTAAQLSDPALGRRRAVALTTVAVGVAVIGLSWAKWLPYSDRVVGVAASGTYPGKSVLSAGAGDGAFTRAWEFTVVYSLAVWKALLAALIIAACVDVLVPRRWLLRVLGRRTPVGGSLAGGIAALPGMMCTCCTAPLAVTMRRAGVPVPAALAFWLGNPVLNPAVIVFLGLVAPGSWLAVRVVLGVLLVFGFSTLVGYLVARRAAVTANDLPAADRAVAAAEESVAWGEVPARLLRSFVRLAIVLVPEYLIVVYLVGLFSDPLGRLLGHGGVVAVVVAAVIGTVLVLPTGGEIPILLGLAAVGASAGVLGALLIALPAVSLPSAIMVGRALGWRLTAVTAGATVVAAVLGGGLLSALN